VSDRIKIALRPTVRMHDFDVAAWRADWDIVDLLDETDKRPRQVIYTDGDNLVHYIEDSMLGLDYIIIVGPEGKMADMIRKKLDTLMLEEILAQLASARDSAEKVEALRLLAAAVPTTSDQRAFDAVVKALHDTDPEVRMAAGLTTTYAEWRAFVDPLARVVEQETDPEARERISVFLEAHEQRWPRVRP
jgi:hypothetical protein